MSGISPGRVPSARFVYYLCLFKHLGAHGVWMRTSFISKVLKFIIYTWFSQGKRHGSQASSSHSHHTSPDSKASFAPGILAGFRRAKV